MTKTNWYTLNIQLFGGEANGSVVGETGDSVADAGQNRAETDGENFDELINGRFKEDFTRKTQAIIDKRFSQTRQLEDYKARVSPAVDMLMEKYGIAPGQEGRLADAIRGSSDGRDEKKADGVVRFKERIGGWINESQRLKESIPDFDLRKEIRSSREFSRLLMSGMSVQSAYEAVHRKEILANAVSETAEQVRRQVVEGIQAKGMRPVENGISSDSAVMTAIDVNSLTSRDIIKILKQVENGASIKF